MMLDYDMLASPNYVRFIYDGDGNAEAGNPAGPEGSGKVEQVFEDWFAAQGLESERVPFDGRSDYVGFTDRGIPAGGVFAGAEGEKTAEEEADLRRRRGLVVRPVLPPALRQPDHRPHRCSAARRRRSRPRRGRRRQAGGPRKMAGGAIKSLEGARRGAASYAV